MGVIIALSIIEAALLGFVWEVTFCVAILSALLGANLMWLALRLERGQE